MCKREHEPERKVNVKKMCRQGEDTSIPKFSYVNTNSDYYLGDKHLGMSVMVISIRLRGRPALDGVVSFIS